MIKNNVTLIKNMIKNNAYLFLLLGVSLVLIFFLSNVYVITWDNLGYYMYLPAYFIWHDLFLQNITYLSDLVLKKYQLSATLYQIIPFEDGKFLIKYTSGIAILNLPFFLIVHFIVTHFTDYPADGLSYPYQLGFYFSTVFYLLTGFYFLIQLLSKLFNSRVAGYIFLILLLGTNIIYLLEIPTIVHIYGLAFYALFMWQMLKWYENQNLRNTILLGLIYGFILAIRPPDGIILIVFLLWKVRNFNEFKAKLKWFWMNKKICFLFCLSALLPFLPQIIYWTLITGKPILNSYINPGEGFDWFAPHTFNFLFSFRKGWIIYTPMVLLLVPSFILLYKHKKEYYYATFVFIVISVYLHSTWTCWWYASSYGQRSMLQSYVVMSIPFGYFVQHILNTKHKYSRASAILILILILFNLFKYYQYRNTIIDPSRMTKAYYFATFFNIQPPPGNIRKLLLLDRPTTSLLEFKNKDDYHLTKIIRILPDRMFELQDNRKIYVDSLREYWIVLDSTNIYTPAYHLSYNEITQAEHAYLIIKTHYYNSFSSANNPLSLVVHFNHNGGAYEYRTFDTEKIYKNNDSLKLQSIEMLYLTPEVRERNDKLAIYLWLRGKHKILTGPIDIEIWEPKKGW